MFQCAVDEDLSSSKVKTCSTENGNLCTKFNDDSGVKC